MKWELVNGTNVETKTFYVIGDNGKIGLAQVIYSDVMGVSCEQSAEDRSLRC